LLREIVFEPDQVYAAPIMSITDIPTQAQNRVISGADAISRAVLLVLTVMAGLESVSAQAIAWTRDLGVGIRPDGVTVDSAGNIYLAGSVTFPLPGQSHLGAADAFLRKYRPDGAELWTRQFGTPVNDGATDVAAE
jgi:hypothetical protein